MELLSVEYSDSGSSFNGGQADGEQKAYLRLCLYVDPVLLAQHQDLPKVVDGLSAAFPLVKGLQDQSWASQARSETVARLTGALILDLQRDLCEWPAARYCNCAPGESEDEYVLSIESIDERVGRFAAQLAVEVVRLLMLNERFDPRLIWIIDLVRHLRRQPRLRLSPKRVAGLLGCSVSSAEWAIEELERYGYVHAEEAHRQQRTRGGCILIVDDSPQVRDLLSRILELLGYDVVVATDGEEGLILLDWADYRAVFVDLVMPCLDGMAFLQRARAQGVTCPIFAVSGYDYRWTSTQLESLGATAYLRKPFSMTEIENLIRAYLD